MIGDRLRELREKRGMKQADLAQAAGFSHSAISRMEAGINKLSSPQARVMLAKGFDMPVDKLNAYLDDDAIAKLRDALRGQDVLIADDIERLALQMYPEAGAVELHISVTRDGNALTTSSTRYAWVGLLGADGFGISSARGEPAATHQEALANLLKLLQATK